MPGEDQDVSVSGETGQGTSNKVQVLMKKATEDVYWSAVADMEAESKRLSFVIEQLHDVDMFRDSLDRWMQQFNELSIAERDWFRCLDPPEQPTVEKIFQGTRDRCCELRDRACARLDVLIAEAREGEYTPVSFTRQDQPDSDVQGEEVRAMRERIRQLEAKISESESRENEVFAQGRLPSRLLERSPYVAMSACNENNNNDGYRTLIDDPRHQPRVLSEVGRCDYYDRPTTPSVHSVMSNRRSVAADERSDFVDSVKVALSSLSRREILPRTEPEVFTGDMLKFPVWWNTFKMLIERVAETPQDKLMYLGRYTGGEAQDTIAWYLTLMEDDTAYDQAKRELFRTYGDRVKLAETYRAKLRSWPAVRRGDVSGLRKFANFLWQCKAASSAVGFMGSLDQPEENAALAKKLPSYLSERWNRLVVDRLYRDNSDEYTAWDSDYPSFGEFCKFVDREARIADGPCVNKEKTDASQTFKFNGRDRQNQPGRDRRTSTALSTNARPGKENSQDMIFDIKCLFCNDSHFLDNCTKFLKQDREKKRDFAFQHSLCFGCLRRGHGVMACRRKNPALIGRPEPREEPERQKEQKSAVSNRVIAEERPRCLSSMVVPVMLQWKGNPSKKLMTYALLDSQSDSCFVRDDLLEKLDATSTEVQLNLTTMGTRCTIDTKLTKNLIIRGVTENEEIAMPDCYSRGEIPCTPGSIPRIETVSTWPHLTEVADSLVPYRPDIGVGLLVGYNCSRALMPVEVISGKDSGQPFGIKTPLGWSVVGNVSGGDIEGHHSYCYTIKTQEVTVDQVKAAFDITFEDTDKPDMKKSQEDLKFVQLMEKQTVFTESGHVELPLPFRDEDQVPPNSRFMAERRFRSLQNKLNRNEDFRKKYIAFIQKMIDHKYVEEVKEGEVIPRRVWYLPHQGVQHPRKPDVVRVVHDGSAEVGGVSLNNMLLPGPDQNNLLVGVLLRFRLGLIGFTCDIEGMFLQVSVWGPHRDMLRFLWYSGNDTNNKVVDFRVCVHLFGATSSPACATYALRAVAQKFGEEFHPDVTEFIVKYFYVDDGLRSVTSGEEALRIIRGSIDLCAKGGFKLHKFVCNDPKIFEQIPENMRAKDVTPDSIKESEAEPYTVLGVPWSLYDDTFRFEVKQPERCTTKRQMLSFLGSIYDPMGLISPIVLKGRMILQELCRSGASWDKKADKESQENWDNWMNELGNLKELKVDRCIQRSTQGVKRGTLHIFGDASSKGYGVCAYLEVTSDGGSRDSSLIYAKARVNPIKPVTVPRMELQASVLAVKTKEMLTRELTGLELTYRFYTDSKVVMGYILNSKKRCRLYVTNRVQVIRELSNVKDWSYVNTKLNPADLSSRGATPEELRSSNLWWHGPIEIFGKETEQGVYEIAADDPELTKEARTMATSSVSHPFVCLDRIGLLSDWTRMTSTLAIWRRFLKCCQAKVNGQPAPEYNCYISVSEREEAAMLLTRGVQQDAFPHLYSRLGGITYPMDREEYRDRERLMGDDRRLRKVDPYLDEQGIMRVGGRVRRAELPLGWRHPAILPSTHPVSVAIIRFYHRLIAHGAKGPTIIEIRNAGFWILRARYSVNKVLSKCVTCRRYRGQPMQQMMAELPAQRLEVAPPFTHVGADMFGPFLIKDGRSMKKRWVCLFTCMVMRAVHLEVCDDLSTNSFINAYRRLVARRGPIRTLFSDCGTNILGSRAELSRGLQALDSNTIQQRLSRDGCDYVEFRQIPPAAPHMGGVWERMVRSVKQALSVILAQLGEQLSSESLHTFVLEAELIVNNRPLTVNDGADPDATEPLTPSQLLTLKPKGALPPPGTFVKEDVYCKSRWRRVQYAADEFWLRWKREYIPLLQQRNRWTQSRENLSVGDIVLIKDLNTPRSQWPLARVTDIRVSEDGLVRSATVKTKTGEYSRPIHKLVFLLTPEQIQDDDELQTTEPSGSDDDPEQ